MTLTRQLLRMNDWMLHAYVNSQNLFFCPVSFISICLPTPLHKKQINTFSFLLHPVESWSQCTHLVSVSCHVNLSGENNAQKQWIVLLLFISVMWISSFWIIYSYLLSSLNKHHTVTQSSCLLLCFGHASLILYNYCNSALMFLLCLCRNYAVIQSCIHKPCLFSQWMTLGMNLSESWKSQTKNK